MALWTRLLGDEIELSLVDSLISALGKEKDTEVRRGIVAALGTTPAAKAVPVLTRILEQEMETNLRSAAPLSGTMPRGPCRCCAKPVRIPIKRSGTPLNSPFARSNAPRISGNKFASQLCFNPGKQ